MFIYKFNVKGSFLPEWLATIVCRYWDESETIGEGTRSENVNKYRNFMESILVSSEIFHLPEMWQVKKIEENFLSSTVQSLIQ